MRVLLQRVPQLQRLAVFDAVATAGGFTAAAHVLGISQPAVSRHIRRLETQLGTSLVERGAGPVRLTESGRRLADGIAAGFGAIERALHDLADRRDSIVIAVQPAMMTSWLVPALDELERLTESSIRLQAFDRRRELAKAGWDLAVVPGGGDWPEWESTLLFREAVRPLAAPGFAAEHGLDAEVDPDRLAKLNLLHIDAVERPSMTWQEWFFAAGSDLVVPSPQYVYDSYPSALQEAMVGRGVALGWRHLLGDLTKRGLLVPVGPLVDHIPVGHHLCWATGRNDARFELIGQELQHRLDASSDSLD